LLLSALLASSGCSKSGPPQPLPPEQAPTELTQAFTKAKPELKVMAGQAVAAIEAKRYPEASVLLLELSSNPALDAKARDVVTRTTLSVNQLLRDAQTNGDPQAAEHLRRLQQSK